MVDGSLPFAKVRMLGAPHIDTEDRMAGAPGHPDWEKPSGSSPNARRVTAPDLCRPAIEPVRDKREGIGNGLRLPRRDSGRSSRTNRSFSLCVPQLSTLGWTISISWPLSR